MTVTHLNPPPPPGEPAEDFPRGVRNPPSDVDAERCVLGSAMLAKDAVADLRDAGLQPGEFYAPKHETVWRAILAVYDRREPVDAVTVSAELGKRGELVQIGGPAYLHTLIEAPPAPGNATFYARIVREKATLRGLVTAGTRIVQLGYADDGGELDDIVDAAQAEVGAVADARLGEGAADDIEDAINESLDLLQNGDKPGLPTGLTDLDRILNGGIRSETITTIGARPGVGKTTVGLHIALNVADNGGMVGLTSLERNVDDLLLCAYANRGGVDYGRLQRAPQEPLTEPEWRRVSHVAERLRGSGLWIPRRPWASVATIRADIRRMQRRRGRCDLWVVDYLQLVTPASRKEVREQQVAGIMRSLKLTVLELGTPIILMAQLSREGEKAGREPVLTDLRESGSIEQDSDNVILLHRELDPDKGDATLMGLKVAKNRRGAVQGFPMAFEGHYQRLAHKTWSPSDALRAG
jgi:replicative DNA helicase